MMADPHIITGKKHAEKIYHLFNKIFILLINIMPKLKINCMHYNLFQFNKYIKLLNQLATLGFDLIYSSKNLNIKDKLDQVNAVYHTFTANIDNCHVEWNKTKWIYHKPNQSIILAANINNKNKVTNKMIQYAKSIKKDDIVVRFNHVSSKALAPFNNKTDIVVFGRCSSPSSHHGIDRNFKIKGRVNLTTTQFFSNGPFNQNKRNSIEEANNILFPSLTYDQVFVKVKEVIRHKKRMLSTGMQTLCWSFDNYLDHHKVLWGFTFYNTQKSPWHDFQYEKETCQLFAELGLITIIN